MRKILYLFIITISLAACGEAEALPSFPVAEVRATAAANADGGQEPVVVFVRAPEGVESLEEFRIYEEGRSAVIRATSGGVDVSEEQLSAETVDALLQDLEAADFFETASAGEEQWTDTIDYLITASRDGQGHSLSLGEVTPQTSVQRLQSLVVMERFVFEQFQ